MNLVPPQEKWLPVVGYQALYEVSDLGQVRSVDRHCVYKQRSKWGQIITARRDCAGKILSPYVGPSGHFAVNLWKNGRGKTHLVHALVLKAFVGPCPPKHECCHHDDNPSNNVLTNLRWGTRASNNADGFRNGKRPQGRSHPNAKLKDSDIPVIRSLIGKLTYVEIGRRYGVDHTIIYSIRKGRIWKHVR